MMSCHVMSSIWHMHVHMCYPHTICCHHFHSGNYGGWKAKAIGANNAAAQSILKSDYKTDEKVTLEVSSHACDMCM